MVSSLITSSKTVFEEPQRVTDRPHWLGHVPFAMWLVEVFKPRVIVELGTETGVSFCAFCQAAKVAQVPVKAFAVDNWVGDIHTGDYGEQIYTELHSYVTAHYSDFAELMRMDFDSAHGRFEDASIDLLHIDGCHTYDAVRHDFETWLPKVSPRGVVIFHDIAVRRGEFGVWKFWEEISTRYPHHAFSHSNGLGVLLVGTDVPAGLQEVICADYDGNVDPSLRLFEVLGSGLVAMHTTNFEMDRLKQYEEALSNAEALAFERLALVEETTRRAENAEAALAEASARTLQVLADVGPKLEHAAKSHAAALESQRRATELEVRIVALEERLREAQAQASVMQASIAWRAAESADRLFEGRPGLRRVVRQGLRLAARSVRVTKRYIQKAQKRAHLT